jgi:hypothetical protein
MADNGYGQKSVLTEAIFPGAQSVGVSADPRVRGFDLERTDVAGATRRVANRNAGGNVRPGASPVRRRDEEKLDLSIAGKTMDKNTADCALLQSASCVVFLTDCGRGRRPCSTSDARSAFWRTSSHPPSESNRYLTANRRMRVQVAHGCLDHWPSDECWA